MVSAVFLVYFQKSVEKSLNYDLLLTAKQAK